MEALGRSGPMAGAPPVLLAGEAGHSFRMAGLRAGAQPDLVLALGGRSHLETLVLAHLLTWGNGQSPEGVPVATWLSSSLTALSGLETSSGPGPRRRGTMVWESRAQPGCLSPEAAGSEFPDPQCVLGPVTPSSLLVHHTRPGPVGPCAVTPGFVQRAQTPPSRAAPVPLAQSAA